MKRYDIHLVMVSRSEMPSRRISEDVNRILTEGLPEGMEVGGIVTSDSLEGLFEYLGVERREAEHEGQD